MYATTHRSRFPKSSSHSFIVPDLHYYYKNRITSRLGESRVSQPLCTINPTSLMPANEKRKLSLAHVFKSKRRLRNTTTTIRKAQPTTSFQRKNTDYMYPPSAAADPAAHHYEPVYSSSSSASFADLSTPCLTASRTVLTVTRGATVGVVPAWYTPVRTRMLYQSSSTVLSYSFVPRISTQSSAGCPGVLLPIGGKLINAYQTRVYRQQNRPFWGRVLRQRLPPAIAPARV